MGQCNDAYSSVFIDENSHCHAMLVTVPSTWQLYSQKRSTARLFCRVCVTFIPFVNGPQGQRTSSFNHSVVVRTEGLPFQNLFIITRVGQAVAVLLTLLSLGIRNIRLGPLMPAFFTPDIAGLLQEKFNLRPISTPDCDLAEAFAAPVPSSPTSARA